MACDRIGIRSKKDGVLFTIVVFLSLFVSGIFILSLLGLFTFPQWKFNTVSLIILVCSVITTLVSYHWTFLGLASLFYKPLNLPDLPEGSNYPRVSVIIPAHNEENVIGDIVQDLLAQSYPNLEIIVVAHNHSDGTVKVLSPFMGDPRLKVIEYRTPQSGKGLALNKGLSVSTGEIIGEFDADNRIKDREMIKKAVKYFLNTDAGAIQAKLKVRNADFNLLTKYQEVEYTLFSHLFWAGRNVLGKNSNCGGTGVFFRREILERIGGWDNSLVEDYSIFRKFSKAGVKILYAPDVECYDEKPPTWSAIMRQRGRWQKGTMDIFFNEIRNGCWTGVLDFIYSLSPFAIPIFYLMTLLMVGSLIVGIPYWYPPVSVWLSGTLLTFAVFYMILKKAGAIELKRYIPLYYLFSFHWLVVFFFALRTKSWSQTKTQHYGDLKHLTS